MDINIRLSTPEDLEAVIEVQTQSLLSLSSHYSSRQVDSLIISQTLARSIYKERVLVAEYQDKIVGCGCLFASHNITGLFVHPDFIRQGIGTKLLEAMTEFSIQNNQRHIGVLSALSAVEFYQKRGFHIVQHSGFWSENKVWIPCVSLKKKLLPAPSMVQSLFAFVTPIQKIPPTFIWLFIINLGITILPKLIKFIKDLYNS